MIMQCQPGARFNSQNLLEYTEQASPCVTSRAHRRPQRLRSDHCIAQKLTNAIKQNGMVCHSSFKPKNKVLGGSVPVVLQAPTEASEASCQVSQECLNVTGWPLLILSMTAASAANQQSDNDDDDTSASSNTSGNTRGRRRRRRRRNSIGAGDLSANDSEASSQTSSTSAPGSSTQPATPNLPQRRRLPRPRSTVQVKQQIANRLVQLLKSVLSDQLQAAIAEAGLAPASDTPSTLQGRQLRLPAGSYIDEEDGLLKCNCRLPVRYLMAKKPGPNQGRWFYRCADLDTRDCFFKFEDDMVLFPEDIQLAAQAAGEVWLGPQKQFWNRLLPDRQQTVRQSAGQSQQQRKRFVSSPDQIVDTSMSEAGAWGEAYLFLWFRLVLPEFDTDCWVSSNKRYLYPEPGGRPWSQVDSSEPPYDFIYTDSQGFLGVAGATYLIDAKCTRGVAVMSGANYQTGLRPITVSANEWSKAEELSNYPTYMGSYIIIHLDRIQPASGFRPRLVTVLVDPYGMTAVMGSVAVRDVRRRGRALKELYDYPVQPDVVTTGQLESEESADSQW